MDLLQKIRWYLLDDDSSDLVGQYGEDLTADVLKWSKRFGYKGAMLRNVFIPKENGETSEIDLLYITQKGIFVIESKNYSGWIFGNGNDQYWTQSLPNKQKKRFYNPMKQNRTHIR
ncbi:MAG: NERD domain-containing protein [Oscillospiraceae bacterium]|nr:NERD domain-containing protein [Oscillospiraceae bacterium]